jgi:hypothetical protein
MPFRRKNEDILDLFEYTGEYAGNMTERGRKGVTFRTMRFM